MNMRIVQAITAAALLLAAWGAHASDNPMTTSAGYRFAPRGADCPSAEDPMSWPAWQWRSPLFDNAPDVDPRCARRVRREVPEFFAFEFEPAVLETLVQPTIVAPPRHREPQIWIDGVKTRWAQVAVGATAQARAQCRHPGMLVLTWTGTRAQTVCPAGGKQRGRLITPPVQAPSSADRG